jgi:hypothetical protein
VESDSSQASSKSQNESARLIAPFRPDELRPHPSYAKHGLTVPASKLSALRERGELAFAEFVTITRDRTIIDGYARWELAKQLGHPILHCVEYELSEAEALQRLLEKHCRSDGLNAFSRIMLALDLEPDLTQKARANKQAGGQQKGWSNLTKAEQVHVRSKIAKAAAVSTGNVTKVKQLLESIVPEIREALYGREVSIHWAWKLRNAGSEDQLDALGRLRFQEGLMTEIRQRAARRRKRGVSRVQNADEILSRLNELGGEELKAVRVTVLKDLEPEVFITEALARIIGLEQSKLWNQSTFYKIRQQYKKALGQGRSQAGGPRQFRQSYEMSHASVRR